MALNHTDTELQTLKINNFATLADYQAAYAQGLIDSNELSFIDENLQPDWNQNDSEAADYIKNKPTLATVATSGSYNDLGNKPTLSTVATSGSYNDLTDKPSVSTVNDAVLTIQKNSITVGTFSANASADKTVNITVQAVGTLNTSNATAQSTSASESLSGTVKLHKVSKTGNYRDLLNKPTIPTVGSGILSVNIGTYTIGTFGANDGSNKTITLPTATDAQIDALFSGFSVTVTVGTAGGGTVSASPASVSYGGSSTVTAAANTNWAFLKWSDNNTDNPRTISNITENVSLTAIFEQTAFTVTAVEPRFLVPSDVDDNNWRSQDFVGTSTLSLSTASAPPIGTVTSITVQKNSSVYLYDMGDKPSFYESIGNISTSTIGFPVCNGYVLCYEYSTDNGMTWTPVFWKGNTGNARSMQVQNDTLVRFVHTGIIYTISGSYDGTMLEMITDPNVEFTGYIGCNDSDNAVIGNYVVDLSGNSSGSFALAVFDGMGLGVKIGYNPDYSPGDLEIGATFNDSYDNQVDVKIDSSDPSLYGIGTIVFGTSMGTASGWTVLPAPYTADYDVGGVTNEISVTCGGTYMPWGD